MRTSGSDPGSWATPAGLGGAGGCRLALELLGGTALVGGLVTVIGFSSGVTYAAVVGFGGVLAVLLALGHQQVGEVRYDGVD